MKLSRQIILTTLMLGSLAGTISAMFQGQYPQFNSMDNMGNMFGQQYRYRPQQPIFNQMPRMRMRQQFQNSMLYPMMNQFGNSGQATGEYALAAFMNWMMTGQQHYLQGAIRNSIRSLAHHYYPEKLRNIWWTRIIIDTALARLTTVGVAKVMIWFNDQKTAQDIE